MLDWKREAADELRNYTNRKAAIENIRDQIADLATEITSIRSASADGSPVAGGSNGRDDALVNNILKRERLEEAQRLTENRVRRVDRALNQLSERDRCVLQRFYITPCIGGVERLCRELAVEKPTVYRWKDRALRNFTIIMYGITES